MGEERRQVTCLGNFMLVQLTVRKSRLIRRSYEMDNRAEQTHPAQLSSAQLLQMSNQKEFSVETLSPD